MGVTNLWRSIRFTVVFAILLGLLYPLGVTGLSNLLFPIQSKGSMVSWNGQLVGSELIAQSVTDPRLFWARPSAVKYAANDSGGSNDGPTDEKLIQEVRGNIKRDGAVAGTPMSAIAPDMVESSASGLDPDISIPNAMMQIPRIAMATGISEASLKALVEKDEQGPFLGLWGERMVNVMKLNIDLMKELRR